MTSSAIAANGLRKSHGDHTVPDGIDLTVPPKARSSPSWAPTARASPPR